MNPPLRLLVAFDSLTQQQPDFVIGVDGRDMWLAGIWGYQGRWQVHVPDLDAQVIFTARTAAHLKNAAGRSLPPWSRAIAGVCHILEEQQRLPVEGARFVMVGDEPPGPRYEFSLALAFAAACYQAQDEAPTTAALVDLVERGMRTLGG